MAVRLDTLIDQLHSRTTPLSAEKCRDLAELLWLWELEATEKLLTDVFIKEPHEAGK